MKSENIVKRELADSLHELAKYYALHSPFGMVSYRNHYTTILMRKEIKEPCDMDREFLEQLWNTLKSWGLKSRGAKLIDKEKFVRKMNKASVLKKLKKIWNKEIHSVEDQYEIKEIVALVTQLIYDDIVVMGVGDKGKKPQLVGGSKLLHHILPGLVPPMDREYTMTYFYASKSTSRKRFIETFNMCFKVAEWLKEKYGNGLVDYLYEFGSSGNFAVHFDDDVEQFSPLAVSIPKLIDDSIIAWLLMYPNVRE